MFRNICNSCRHLMSTCSVNIKCSSIFFLIYLFYLFIFGCVGSLLLGAGFLQLWQAGATLRCGARTSHCGGFSCCGARALGTRASVVVAHGLGSCGSQAQQLWLTGSRVQAQQSWRMGPVAPRHVVSSRTRARTRVPCIGRQILNHCATREALYFFFNAALFLSE